MESNTIKVNMLGEFSITYGDRSIDDSGSRSKKFWTLLQYLLVFRDREVPQSEVIDLLWPEENVTNPANTLKVLVHRIRQSLDTLGLEGKSLIVGRRSTYSWQNVGFTLEVDADLFEQLQQKAETEEDVEQKLAYILDAIRLYKGDFLPKTAYEVWAVPICAYYHGLYVKLVKEAVVLLREAKRFEDVISICRTAVTIDPYDEALHISLIEALADSGRYREALSHYESATKMFYSQFGVTPSTEFMAVYKRVIKMTNDVETDLNVIKSSLREIREVDGAFYCEYEIFKEIYQLEARAQGRTGQNVFLSLLTVSGPDGEPLKQKTLTSAMEKLMHAIGSSLRHGDVYTRFSVSQYLIMLPCVTVENGEMVMERIVKHFRRENPRSAAVIRFSIQPIDPNLV